MLPVKPKISIVIPLFNREEILTTLELNKNSFSNKEVEIIVVDCKSKNGLANRIARLDIAKLRVISLPVQEFNKALALNVGTYLSRGEFVFFLDADIVLNRSFLSQALHKVQNTRFITVKHVEESEPTAKSKFSTSCLSELAFVTEFLDKKGNRARVETNRIHFQSNSRGGPGLVILAKKKFLNISGMNSNLKGWGWEDIDLLIRLQLRLALHHVRWGKVIHLSHNDSVRYFNGSSRSESEMKNYIRCLANYHVGNFLGTYRNDLAQWKNKIKVIK
jgi:glycosyltransferase involved in cell wall biosynthesis